MARVAGKSKGSLLDDVGPWKDPKLVAEIDAGAWASCACCASCMGRAQCSRQCNLALALCRKWCNLKAHAGCQSAAPAALPADIRRRDHTSQHEMESPLAGDVESPTAVQLVAEQPEARKEGHSRWGHGWNGVSRCAGTRRGPRAGEGGIGTELL